MVDLAPRNNNETARWLRGQVKDGNHDWLRKCLMVQRMARGVPAMFPTASSAAMATPQNERIFRVEDLRRGMIAYSTDDRPGTAGHVFFVAGRFNGQLITITNDAKSPGRMDYVPFDFYRTKWGHRFQFGATWVNGYDFSDFNAKPEPVFKGSVAEQYEEGARLLRKIYREKRKKYGDNHPLVKRLNREVNHMNHTLDNWSKKKN